ncbi:MAG: hypothetical protein WC043_08185 [Pseudobdellovibrionaceae bacterium]
MFRPATFMTLLASSVILCSSSAYAGGKVEFDCPDLHNEKKRSIEPLFQGYDGWFFRDNDLKMDFSISPETAGYFGRLNKSLDKKGIKLVFVPLLSRALMAPDQVNHEDIWQENYDVNLARHSYAALVADLEGQGINIISLLPLSETYEKADPYQYNFKRDIHWKPEGAKIVAGIVADNLKKIDGYDSLTKVTTLSKERAQVGRAGTITEELQKLCKGDIEAEPFKPFEGERVLDQNADSLFGAAETTTPLALVGTSFSAVDEFNFLPFLEEGSKLEVANFSIPGGGMFTSLISYLSSPFFQEHTPPIMVWETQVVYDFNKGTENFFRQAIPAIEGPCAGDNIIAHKKVELTGEDKPYIVLDGLKKLGVSGNGYYIHLVSDNLGFKQFTFEMDYENQDGEWFPVDRSDRYDNKGHYYVELSDKISARLDRITMKDVRNTRANLDITLCKEHVVPKNQPSPDNTPKEK